MSKLIRLGAVLLILILSVFLLMRQPPQTIFPGTARIKLPDGTLVTTGLAQTAEEQRKGLSGRESLAQNEGLLFLYDVPQEPSFWMKDMLISIDILWINDETVVGFEENAQPQEPPRTIYTPKTDVDKVLEVPAGFVSTHQIKVGDMLDIELSKE